MKYRIHANRWTSGPFRIKWINEDEWTATVYVQIQDIWIHLCETNFKKTKEAAMEAARELIRDRDSGPWWFDLPEEYEEVETP